MFTVHISEVDSFIVGKWMEKMGCCEESRKILLFEKWLTVMRKQILQNKDTHIKSCAGNNHDVPVPVESSDEGLSKYTVLVNVM